MKVLVTGANGFIGSGVVRTLVEARHEVVALDRPTAPADRLTAVADRIERVAVDLDEPSAIRALVEAVRPEALIHLAWYANPVDYLVSHANLASLSATAGLVQAALAAGCHKLVLAGTCVEYRPLDRALREDDPVEPRTLYGACKHAAWLVTTALASSAGVELAWARVFHLHGPGEDPRRLIQWVASELRAGRPVELTDGSQVRDHLHVTDVAAGLVALLSAGASGVYNVCSGEPVTLKEVLETVGEIVGRPELLRFGARPHRPDEMMFLCGNSRRLRSLGWKPRFGLKDGLADAISNSAVVRP
jgi:nucleoside-diphosphate-sugar epimerase